MKTSKEDLAEFFNNNPQLKRLTQKDLSDEEFAEIIMKSFDENQMSAILVDFVIDHFEGKFKFKEIEDSFFKTLKFEITTENHDFIFFLFQYFVVIKTISLPLKDKAAIKQFKQIATLKEFQEEANKRINNLQDDLLKKYEPYNEYINLKFAEFINSFNKELNAGKLSISELNGSRLLGINIINSQISQQGRPNDPFFDDFLLKINKLSDDLCLTKKYAQFIKPFFIFIAENYPKLIDIHDVNDTEKLRQRINYLKAQQPLP